MLRGGSAATKNGWATKSKHKKKIMNERTNEQSIIS